jgi:hypothetical protein
VLEDVLQLAAVLRDDVGGDVGHEGVVAVGLRRPLLKRDDVLPLDGARLLLDLTLLTLPRGGGRDGERDGGEEQHRGRREN